ncbi:AraC family transcriptional regulator [Rhizobium terrae]|uniref:AraC family transcriptional regulator n=1 Tax=Rhizobium terrae TaxID=2171756 RepID=UPI001D0223AD|nr:AraC family transcriptional regulator [Rhizobium terrae]
MESSGVIAASVIDGVLSTIHTRGMDRQTIAARVGIGDEALLKAQHFLPLTTFTSILEIAAEEKSDPLLALSLGKVFKFDGLGMVARVFHTAPTLGEGIEKFVRYFPALQSNTNSALNIENGLARFSYSIKDATIRDRVQDAVFTEMVFCSMLEATIGAGWRPSCIDFEHLPGEHLAIYQAHFACPLRFGRRENAIFFPAQQLDRPLDQYDFHLQARLEIELGELIDGDDARLDLITSIKAWITAALCRSASLDIEDAARDFGMSLRSFQRKLSECGVNYADIRNSVRIQIARSMLASTTLQIPVISQYLGYSEPSAFCRSFKHLTGDTPVGYRQRRVI